MTTMSTNYLMQHYHHQNTVLNKDDVGQSKLTHYSLPTDEFTYGAALKRDKEGAQLVSSHWAFHDRSRVQNPMRNFKQLNKDAVYKGCINSKQQQEFRKTNDARFNLKQGKAFIDYTLPEEEFRYGRANRPPTPINYVVGNMYGLQSEVQLELTYQQREQERFGTTKTGLFVKNNKGQKLRQEEALKKIKSLDKFTKTQFKIQRFEKVEKRLTSFNQSNAGKAFSATLKDRQQIKNKMR